MKFLDVRMHAIGRRAISTGLGGTTGDVQRQNNLGESVQLFREELMFR